MPPKKKLQIVCTDKMPLKQGQIRGPPGYCYKRGLKSGFAAGIITAEKKAVKKQKSKVLKELKTKAETKKVTEQRSKVLKELKARAETKQKKSKVVKQLKNIAEERSRMAMEDVNVSKKGKKSLKAEYEKWASRSKAEKPPPMLMFLKQLRFENPEYDSVPTRKRVSMGTKGATEWALKSGEYSE